MFVFIIICDTPIDYILCIVFNDYKSVYKDSMDNRNKAKYLSQNSSENKITRLLHSENIRRPELIIFGKLILHKNNH